MDRRSVMFFFFFNTVFFFIKFCDIAKKKIQGGTEIVNNSFLILFYLSLQCNNLTSAFVFTAEHVKPKIHSSNASKFLKNMFFVVFVFVFHFLHDRPMFVFFFCTWPFILIHMFSLFHVTTTIFPISSISRYRLEPAVSGWERPRV